jgi:hypothetical protein
MAAEQVEVPGAERPADRVLEQIGTAIGAAEDDAKRVREELVAAKDRAARRLAELGLSYYKCDDGRVLVASPKVVVKLRRRARKKAIQ